MKRKLDRSLWATFFIIAYIGFVLLIVFYNINVITAENNRTYLNRTIKEASSDFYSKVIEDQNVLLTLADVIASYDTVDGEETQKLVKSFQPRTISNRIAVLLPDDSMVTVSGKVTNSGLSFEEVSELGIHLSGVVASKVDGQLGMRDFVPVVKDDEVVAMLYGMILISKLPERWSYHSYDGSSTILIVDKSTDALIYNGYNSQIQNINTYSELGNLYNKVKTNSAGVYESYVSEEDEKCYIAYERIENTTWTMIMIIPEKKAYSLSKGTRTIWSIGAVMIIIGIILYLVWFMRYTRKRNRMEMLTRHKANHDTLTNLYNREKFDEVGERLSDGYHFALFLMDVDLFKQINDEHGHDVGDRVLEAIGQILVDTFSESDYPCRYGGDEFAVIVPGITPRQRDTVKSYINEINAKIKKLDIDDIKLTLSIGIAFSDAISPMDEVFKMADGALYEVKKNGRNGYGFGEYSHIVN